MVTKFRLRREQLESMAAFHAPKHSNEEQAQDRFPDFQAGGASHSRAIAQGTENRLRRPRAHGADVNSSIAPLPDVRAIPGRPYGANAGSQIPSIYARDFSGPPAAKPLGGFDASG